MTDISIDSAAARIKVPTPLIERAVELGLAVSTKEKQPFRFSEDEISHWLNWDGLGKLIQERLRRNERNEYLGSFIEPGGHSQKNEFVLPFRKCWLVTDGGKERAPNGWIRQFHYYLAPCIRWAWDLCVIHPDDSGKCHIGMSAKELLSLRFRKGQEEDTPDYEHSEPWENEQYRNSLNPDSSATRDHYCCGVDVIAPADGVIMTRTGVLDDTNFAVTIEEAVEADDDRQFSFMIDHGQNEFSQIAHILAKSVAVRLGQKVKQGQFLCKAGGRQFMPHLHWGVWDSWNPLFAQALPILISECLVFQNGEFAREKNMWLERGLLVKNLENHNREQSVASNGDSAALHPRW